MSAPRAVRGARPSRGEPNGRGARSVRWRSVALPIEHGAWGFLLEPALLGLLVAASWAGRRAGARGAGGPAAADAAQPGPDRCAPRQALPAHGARVALRGGLRRAAGRGRFGGAGAGGERVDLLPVALAAPLAGLQLWLDARGRARELLPEAAGAVAMGSLAASVALAGGWSLLPALGLWALLAARAVPAIVYVRARLRLERGQALDRRPSASCIWRPSPRCRSRPSLARCRGSRPCPTPCSRRGRPAAWRPTARR
jgi:hypothetical protein